MRNTVSNQQQQAVISSTIKNIYVLALEISEFLSGEGSEQ